MAGLFSTPNWNDLRALASRQRGYFTTDQLTERGFSPQLIHYHSSKGKWQRVTRGIYRFNDWPIAPHGELTWMWLWARQEGVWSHQTALQLWGLLPTNFTQLCMTVPMTWAGKSVDVPLGLVLYASSWEQADLTFMGLVPVMGPLRSVLDCIDAGVFVGDLKAPCQLALSRGLFSPQQLMDAAVPRGTAVLAHMLLE